MTVSMLAARRVPRGEREVVVCGRCVWFKSEQCIKNNAAQDSPCACTAPATWAEWHLSHLPKEKKKLRDNLKQWHLTASRGGTRARTKWRDGVLSRFFSKRSSPPPLSEQGTSSVGSCPRDLRREELPPYQSRNDGNPARTVHCNNRRWKWGSLGLHSEALGWPKSQNYTIRIGRHYNHNVKDPPWTTSQRREGWEELRKWRGEEDKMEKYAGQRDIEEETHGHEWNMELQLDACGLEWTKCL